MKNKNKKFKSLKSVLALLQQLQVTHFFERTIMVDGYGENNFINMSIFFKAKKDVDEKIKTVYFNQSDTESELKEKYLEVLEILKME
jgi:hypothetical protein